MGKIQESHSFELRSETRNLTQTKQANAPHASPGASRLGMCQLKSGIFHVPRWAFSCLLIYVETNLGLMRSNLFQIHRFLFNN